MSQGTFKLLLMPMKWIADPNWSYYLLSPPEYDSEYLMDPDGDRFGPCTEGIQAAKLDAFSGDVDDTFPSTATLVLGIGEPSEARLKRLHPAAQLKVKQINMIASMGITLRRHILGRVASEWDHLANVFFREKEGAEAISNYTYWWSIVPGVHWTEFDLPVQKLPAPITPMDIHHGRPKTPIVGNEARPPFIEMVYLAVQMEKRRIEPQDDTQWRKRWRQGLDHLINITSQMREIPMEEDEEMPF